MVKKIIRTIYLAFISIVLISIILASWTSYAFVSQSSKSNEITHVIQDIYANQKSIVFDIIDLYKILIKDTSEPNAAEKKNIQIEKDFLTDPEDNSQLDQTLMTEGNGDNPLGIVIEPSEVIQEPLVNKENEVAKNRIDMDMDMDMDN